MKKFLVIGNINAVTYKEVFPLIKENKMWLGVTLFCGKMPYFGVPKEFVSENDRVIVKEDGTILKQVNSIAWFTNLDHAKRNIPLDLYKKYNTDEYPKYDNYDAIEVSKTAEIPMDYDGVMGVPITFLDKYCHTQFEIVGCSYQYGDCGKHIDGKGWGVSVNNNDIYKRIFIKKRG